MISFENSNHLMAYPEREVDRVVRRNVPGGLWMVYRAMGEAVPSDMEPLVTTVLPAESGRYEVWTPCEIEIHTSMEWLRSPVLAWSLRVGAVTGAGGEAIPITMDSAHGHAGHPLIDRAMKQARLLEVDDLWSGIAEVLQRAARKPLVWDGDLDDLPITTMISK